MTDQHGDTWRFMLVPMVENGAISGYRYLSFLAKTAWDQAQMPSAQFTLFLERMPVADDPYILTLIEKGSLDLAIHHRVPPAVLEGLRQRKNLQIEPLFIRSLKVKLVARYDDGKSQRIASAEFAGQEPQGLISGTLSREQAIAVTRIFQGQSPDPGIFLESVFSFFDPVTAAERRLQADFPLTEVLGTYFIHRNDPSPVSRILLKYFDRQKGQYLPSPLRVKFRETRSRAGNTALSSILAGGKITSVAQFNNPGYHKPGVMSVAYANPNVYQQFGPLWQMQNLQLAVTSASTKPRSLPIIIQPDSPVWLDINDSSKLWYLPKIELVAPVLSQPVQGNNFLFVFRKIGADQGGNPILEGEIRLKVKFSKSNATQDALRNTGAGKTAVPVRFNQISYYLEIPFLDQSDGSPKTSQVQASEVEPEGQDVYKLTFRLTNDWIRACYGVISVADFQAGRKLKLKTTFSFDGYQRTVSSAIAVQAGNKLSGLATLSKAKSAPPGIGPYFDETRNKLVLPEGEFIFKDNGPGAKSGAKGPTAPATLNTAVINRYSGLSGVLTPVAQTNKLSAILSQANYTISTYVKNAELEVFFNCAAYSAFYIEENNGQQNIVGCKEPYQLGKIQFRMFQEIPELKNDYLSVYRSAQSPNQFMVLPKKYKITRFTDHEDSLNTNRAYRPCILLYSNIDGVNLANSRCIVHITLDPDIPVYVMEALKNDLRNYTSYEPFIQMISEIPPDMSFNWSLPQDLGINNCYAFYRGFQVSFSTDISSIMVLKNMLENGSVTGSVEFRLSDGMLANAAMIADLNQIIGPPDQGPVKVEKKGDKLTLTNMIDKAVIVPKVQKYNPDHTLSGEIQVENTLGKGQQIELSDTDTGKVYFPVYQESNEASTLQEIRSYIEDITCQVIILAPFNFTPVGVEKIEVYARLKGTPEDDAQALVLEGDVHSGEVNIIMPLTDYLTSRIIEYRPVVYMIGQENPVVHDWTEWSMMNNGNTIQLKSADLIDQLK